MAAQNQGLPTPSYPFVDNTAKINPVWFQFLSSLWQRTGGGNNSGNVQSITINAGSGVVASSIDSAGNVTITISLGSISPTAVNSSGPVVGTTGSFINGLSTLGPMQFGTYNTSAITASGYVTIIDASGVPRKLMVGP